MSTDDLTPAQLKVAETIQKLLNLAAKAGTAEEAASATAKAQELLEAHNLSSDTLSQLNGEKTGRREQAAIEGGTFAFQRELWRAVAELNFCL